MLSACSQLLWASIMPSPVRKRRIHTSLAALLPTLMLSLLCFCGLAAAGRLLQGWARAKTRGLGLGEWLMALGWV